LDFTQFNKIGTILKDTKITPEVIGENIVYNGATVTMEFMQAATAFESGDYKLFGNIMGQTLNNVVA